MVLTLFVLVSILSVTHGQWNYAEVIEKSILFYEIQRSGWLPADNRIPWRGNSATGDGSDAHVQKDLTGGWYDAGDHVKFTLPMASTTTTLIYGLIEFEQAYRDAGQYEWMLDAVKWPLDYFLKCHTNPGVEFYGQLGDGNTDHAWWGRPEDMEMYRPAWKIDQGCPGSEIAGEAAAAMAAGYIAFNSVDACYAAELLYNAKQLYNLANNYRGTYHDCITNAQDFYRSWSGYNDELFWAAAWLYRATGEAQYLADAWGHYQGGQDSEFSWDNKWVGGYVLMYQLTLDNTFAFDFQGFMDRWLPGGGVTYTPGGLAWHAQWGSLRYVSNTAFLALVAAKYTINSQEAVWRAWAGGQMDYILGDNPYGRSYVVGFGNNPPQRPHHKSTSCPWAPATCDWNNYNSPDPNPHTLYGALVGGPGSDDSYEDRRDDYVKNEVATDYNGGFTGAIAGLLWFQVQEQMANSTLGK